MDVTCPGCGRAYDENLFRGGRTLHCACGSAVAAPISTRDAARRRPPCFFADAMLGRLARWLRLLGFDTAWEAGIDDGDLVRCAVEQQRIILTRDRRLPGEWRVDGVLVIESETLLDQLREIEAALGLARDAAPFTRCSRCNARLCAAARDDVRRDVPARVLREHDRFLRCPGCRRVYWYGSHADRIRRVLVKIGAVL
jgi:uncharacterized protein with PIN domain